jgi:hypothetical protein
MLSELASSSERDCAMDTNEAIVRWGLAEPARAVSIPTDSAQFCDAAVSVSSTALTIRGRS